MQDRQLWIDNAKAIGIILVVYGHVARGLVASGLWESDALFRIVDSVLYSFHMPLFFFLSGATFLESFNKKGLPAFIGGKFATVVYPYVVWSLLQGCVESAMSSLTNGNVSFHEVLSLFSHPRAQFWFLYALFVVFVFSSLLVFWFGSSSISALLLFSAGSYLAWPFLPKGILTTALAGCLVFFLLGVFYSLYRLRFDGFLFSSRGLFLLSVSFLVCQYVFHFVLDFTFTDVGFFALALAIISILFIVSFSMQLPSWLGGGLPLIGKESMAIFLMHILAGSGVRIVLKKFLGVDVLSVHLLLGCLVGVLLPLFVVTRMERCGVRFLFSAPFLGRR